MKRKSRTWQSRRNSECFYILLDDTNPKVKPRLVSFAVDMKTMDARLLPLSFWHKDNRRFIERWLREAARAHKPSRRTVGNSGT
jgi:hypothetical protein